MFAEIVGECEEEGEKDEKSRVIFDVKPFGSETNMETMITSVPVQSIQIDGLTWGQAKLLSLVFGLKKLQIRCLLDFSPIFRGFSWIFQTCVTFFWPMLHVIPVCHFEALTFVKKKNSEKKKYFSAEPPRM